MMKILILIGLATAIILVAGYGGVKSIDKAFDESSFQADASITDASTVNESEHVECTLNESEEFLVEDVPSVNEDSGKKRLGGISFINSLESGLEEGSSTKMPIFLYLHSKSCGWCKKFEDEVLTDPGVISIVEASFVPVVIEVNEQKVMAGKFKVFGTPTMVFLDGDKEIGRVRGYVDAETFSATLNEIKSSL
jgi:thiol:disulfide interchange protein DsbD